MIITKCPLCGAIEHTRASIDAVCMACGKAKMRLMESGVSLD